MNDETRAVVEHAHVVRAAEDVRAEFDGVAVALPAGEYQAMPIPGAENHEGPSVDHYALRAVGGEQVHAVSAYALAALVEADKIEVDPEG